MLLYYMEYIENRYLTDICNILFILTWVYYIV
jgi:hypothetical protein